MFAYDVAPPLTALFSLATLIALGSSYFPPERQPLVIYILDHVIWFLFTGDPLVRLCFAKSLRAFVQSRLPEFIAVVPIVPFIALNYLFEYLGWHAVSSIYVQAVFFVKFIAYLGRAFTTQSRFFKTNMRTMRAALLSSPSSRRALQATATSFRRLAWGASRASG